MTVHCWILLRRHRPGPWSTSRNGLTAVAACVDCGQVVGALLDDDTLCQACRYPVSMFRANGRYLCDDCAETPTPTVPAAGARWPELEAFLIIVTVSTLLALVFTIGKILWR